MQHQIALFDQPIIQRQFAIEQDIRQREAKIDQGILNTERDAELDLLRLSMTLAHNRGDLTQGMGFWKRTPLTAPVMEHLSRRGRFPPSAPRPPRWRARRSPRR